MLIKVGSVGEAWSEKVLEEKGGGTLKTLLWTKFMGNLHKQIWEHWKTEALSLSLAGH